MAKECTAARQSKKKWPETVQPISGKVINNSILVANAMAGSDRRTVVLMPSIARADPAVHSGQTWGYLKISWDLPGGFLQVIEESRDVQLVIGSAIPDIGHRQH
jgi:hypothetical protein